MHHIGFENSIAYRGLPALRIPAGWTIEWNTLSTLDRVEDGFFGGSVFRARNEGRRFAIDVEFQPEHDANGSFILEVLYQPWPRTEQGRRRKHAPFAFDEHQEVVHREETRSIDELVTHLETWIARCTIWQREGH